MTISNPPEVLLTHDTWATNHLLDACESLTHEQFHQQFEMGLGSLHDTIAHILGAMRGWADMLTAREPRNRIEEGGPYTIKQLRALLADVTDEFAKATAAHPFDDIATAERGGKSYAFQRGGVLVHVATHSMHHRAQCLNMLRHLGVEQPPSSVMEWMLEK